MEGLMQELWQAMTWQDDSNARNRAVELSADGWMKWLSYSAQAMPEPLPARTLSTRS
jgi:hypothetical protein